MQKYLGVVQKRTGASISGATVYVYDSAGATLQTIYSDNGSTTAANPITADADGEYSFYAANGRYRLSISASGMTAETVSDIILHDPADLPLSSSSTTTEVTAGLQDPEVLVNVLHQPGSAPAETIKFGHMSKFTYESSYDNSGAGHYGASLAWYRHNDTGNPNYAIAHESKWEGLNAGATITLASAHDGQLNGIGTITVANINQGRVVSHSGTITHARGLYAQCETEGTITNWVGFYNAEKTGAGTVTNNYAIYNADLAAVVYSAGPICDGTLQVETPSAGATVTMTNKITTLLLTPAGTLATLTVKLPSAPHDGQKAEICSLKEVTALTVNGNGKSIYSSAGLAATFATSLAADGGMTYKYYAGSTLWYRVAS